MWCGVRARNGRCRKNLLGAWFGGFLPTIVFAAFTLTGDFYAGLWYAVAVLVFSSLRAIAFLPETRGTALGAIH